MTPRRRSTDTEEDEQAIGHVVLWGLDGILTRFRYPIAAALVATLTSWGGREYLRARQPDDMDRLLASMTQLRIDTLEVKVIAKAIVDGEPVEQQTKTKALISDRMAVLRLADAKGDQP